MLEKEREPMSAGWSGPFLKYSEHPEVVRDAIMRLANRLGRPFTYDDLRVELELHDGVSIDGRAFGQVLEAVARIRGGGPLWPSLVVNKETGTPGDGFWRVQEGTDRRYVDAGQLSSRGRMEWLAVQQRYCVAAARAELQPLDLRLRIEEIEAREMAETAFLDQLRIDHASRLH
jgi:hypothetical protein